MIAMHTSNLPPKDSPESTRPADVADKYISPSKDQMVTEQVFNVPTKTLNNFGIQYEPLQTIELPAAGTILAAEKRMMQVYKAADILIHPHPTGCQDEHGNERFRTDD